MSKGKIYAFFGKNEIGLDEIIYVGITQGSLDFHTRFVGHKHLPIECYKSVKSIKYIEPPTDADAEILETILINTLQPKYNTGKNYGISPQWFNLSNITLNWIDWEEGRFVNGKYKQYKKYQGRKPYVKTDAGLSAKKILFQELENGKTINEIVALLNWNRKNALTILSQNGITKQNFTIKYNKKQWN